MRGGGTGWGGSGFLTCSTCRTWDGIDDQGRQAIGCGWLPRLPSGVQPISTPFGGPDVKTCQGYLMSQPLVREALDAHLWWEKGQLRDLVGDEDASPLLRFYVETVAGAVAELELSREQEREAEAARQRNRPPG